MSCSLARAPVFTRFNRLNSKVTERPKRMISASLVNQCSPVIGPGRIVTSGPFHLHFGGVEVAKLSNEGFLIAHLLPYITVPASWTTIYTTLLIEPTNYSVEL